MKYAALMMISFFVLAQPGWAGPYEDFEDGMWIWEMSDWGEADDRDYDEGIAALSRAISSGVLNVDDLAMAHGMRGDFYSDMNLKSSAIADYRRVITLVPGGEDAETARKRLIGMGQSP
ncbi:MAG: hypothetical protein ISR48_12280 [Alphaproteobacteria bacterium]|nr:hypothetical protein [Alphaproteobacteria bacterium]